MRSSDHQNVAKPDTRRTAAWPMTNDDRKIDLFIGHLQSNWWHFFFVDEAENRTDPITLSLRTKNAENLSPLRRIPGTLAFHIENAFSQWKKCGTLRS